jgi:cell cycle sensor histidine kinase DivJ
MSALDAAQTLVNELLEAARSGRIIPVRLPGQIEAIQTALKQAEEEIAAAQAKAAPPPGQEEFMKEQAYFIGHAVHELRTPMTSIRGYGDMLPQMGTLSDMQKQFVETIRVNARRMEGLMQDVADMNKLRAGTLKVNPKIDMFKNIALMVEKATRPTAEQTGRTLTFEIPQGLPIMNTDGELLAKAFTKLVENAVRYTRDGGQVTLRAVADGSHLVVTVTDDGIGMTADELRQLGAIYFRSENEHVRNYKGSGLGIPVAYGIFRLLGATVDCQSEADKGTTFTITMTGMT